MCARRKFATADLRIVGFLLARGLKDKGNNMAINNETIRVLKDKLDVLHRIDHEKKLNKRMYIIDTDPNAPICILCEYCQQRGFLFECPIFALPEDGKVVGQDGMVYYRRRGHKPKTYQNVPMRENDCETFEELKPITEEELESLDK